MIQGMKEEIEGKITEKEKAKFKQKRMNELRNKSRGMMVKNEKGKNEIGKE